MDSAFETSVSFIPTINAVINPLNEGEVTAPVDVPKVPEIVRQEATTQTMPAAVVEYKPADVMELMAYSALVGATLALLLKYAFSKTSANE